MAELIRYYTTGPKWNDTPPLALISSFNRPAMARINDHRPQRLSPISAIITVTGSTVNSPFRIYVPAEKPYEMGRSSHCDYAFHPERTDISKQILVTQLSFS